MKYFGNITRSDLITFEGRTVSKITPVQDKQSKEIIHYRFSIADDEGNVEHRKYRTEEIPHLIETERLVVDRGHFSPQRQNDRAIYGRQELWTATKVQREKVDLLVYSDRLMAKYENLGMKRTRESVGNFHPLMEAEYRNYQARKIYGTEKPNASQFLKPLPCADTLLVNSRKFRASGGNPNVFVVPRVEPVDLDIQAGFDFCFVMDRLGKYATGLAPSKREVIEPFIKELTEINIERSKNSEIALFKILSQRQYERWIDKYLDPFLTVLQREGLAAAQKKFGTVEEGRTTDVIGRVVETDAWMMHLVTLDTTREKYNQMTPEERLAVKKVRRWVVVMIDVATRVILGFSICKTPNEQASLEALRMVFLDKTYLFCDAGIKLSHCNYRCPPQEMVNDCGSEFGKHPFGGALFSQAVRTLSGSLMNTVAGVARLRGRIERFFWTADVNGAHYLPGYTANNPKSRNDRKPGDEAGITDDELHTIFVRYIAQYHKTRHRGLNYRTPAAVWEEKSEMNEFDMTQMPSPGQLREACGFYTNAAICEAGIKVGGAIYANEWTRNQRKVPLVDRVMKPGKKLEIKIDPFDLGGISVLANGNFVRVPCVDEEMCGKSLRQWQQEKKLAALKAQSEALEQEGARSEARSLWRAAAEDIARKADVGILGYSQTEIDRIVRENDFGKGQRDMPYVGDDEYGDPMETGFEIANELFNQDEEICEEAAPDEPTSMDLYRNKSKSRKRNKNKESGK
jgi:hypothetical protein